MSIPLNLLALTEGRAPGMCVYGGPGLKKTYAIHSCPYPIQLHDFEGGTGPLLPWIRRRRDWDTEWEVITQTQRLALWELLPKELRQQATILPNPLIDVIHYDAFERESYNHFTVKLGNFDPSAYSTVAIDSLQEFSFEVQTFTKGGGALALEPIANAMLWGPIQERTAIALRRLRNFRNAGVFVYLTGSETIDKDYVTDPRNQAKGQKEEPYNVKGTINLPGKMASTVPHLVDILAHARAINGEANFITKQEPLTGGAAHWEAKDRFGRLDMYMPPSVKQFFNKLYGDEVAKAIYQSGKGGKDAEANQS